MPHEVAPALGVVYDVDGVLRLASPRRQLRRLRAALRRSGRDRRSVLSMPRLVQEVTASHPDADVFYLTAVPDRFAQRIINFLHRDGYPSGTVLTSGRPLALGWLLGAALDRKRAELDRLAEQHPHLRWVLIGDDAGHDVDLFSDFTSSHPDRVAVIALRRATDEGEPWADRPAVPVVSAPNGEEMLPSLRAALSLGDPKSTGIGDWFLTSSERGNDASGLRGWTTGNAARPLVHGRTYFAVLADALNGTGHGDLVLFAGWRADSDELLADAGPTVAEALAGAAGRGALVRGLLWRSHLELLGYHVTQNRTLATELADADAKVLLDQRIRALGSHHQKFIVIRRAGNHADDVAFVGGIDLDRGSRDDADHHGDPQSTASDDEYGPTPARHDVQLEVRGPAVRELEEVFRARWNEKTPLSRLPWHLISDRIHGLPRTASPLPAPTAAPPPDGTCAVQILTTYPRRRPAHPFAPHGERSIARAYAKALARACRLVYIEDQYLWSVDVARIFAAALQRSPQLHLIAVVPRRVDQKVARGAAELGQQEALTMVRSAGGDRVQIFDVENDQGRPIYVHAKVCIIDDVWAAVGSNNLNNRSWTHDSELTAAVLDDNRDPRTPADPAGLGDGARRFARQLRLDLMREHLGRDTDDGLLDPDVAADTVRRQAAALDAWYAGGCHGPKPPGRLRRHHLGRQQPMASVASVFQRWISVPAYRVVLDPDGRPPAMRLRRAY
ncbi:phosphatase domain-containing protein [Mycolicibacterium pulveris]|uniref:phosphatase domain-containing protein n=1 Tax=Mycolicibacterium pulveris TaxID=36813 RepID=UPI003CF1A8E6